MKEGAMNEADKNREILLPSGLTLIENSMQSRAIGFAAEQSRLAGGALTTPYKL